MKQAHILLIGSENAGKTALINALCNESIKTYSTIYQEFRKVQIDKLQLQIYDCPGNPQQEYIIHEKVSVAAIALNLEDQNPCQYLEYHYHIVKDKSLIFFIGCKSDLSLHSYHAIMQQISKLLQLQNPQLFFTSALNQKEISKFKQDLAQLLFQSNQIQDLCEETLFQKQYVTLIDEEQESSFLDKCSQLLNCCFCLEKEK